MEPLRASHKPRDLLRDARAALAKDPNNEQIKAIVESLKEADALLRRHEDEAARYLEAAIRSIETLAVALLGLTITFRNQLAADPVEPGLLRSCWILLAVSIVAGVMHRFSWATAHYTVSDAIEPGRPIKAAVFLSGGATWFAFLAAIVQFVRFALANFP